MYYSGFQSNAFQSNAFQVKRSAVTPNNGLLGGGADIYHHHRPYDTYREQEYHRKIAADKAELKRVENELAENERNRAKALADKTLAKKKAARQLALLEARLQEEISRLRNERIWLIRRIDEEESALVILMMAKRRRLRAG